MSATATQTRRPRPHRADPPQPEVTQPDSRPTESVPLTDVRAWLTAASRRKALAVDDVSIAELSAWAASHPGQVPLINDELAWIALTLADLD